MEWNGDRGYTEPRRKAWLYVLPEHIDENDNGKRAYYLSTPFRPGLREGWYPPYLAVTSSAW
jgi:hypothetical protein